MCYMLVKRKLRFWNIPVTEQLDEYVERAMREDTHVSKSDFVRDAVREKLARMDTTTISETNRQSPPKKAVNVSSSR